MNRGARRAPIFGSEEHGGTFLRIVEEVNERFGLEIHAYSVMPNHYHLLVRSVLGNLSRAMRHLGASYTQALNARHGWDGPIFRGRFRSQLVYDPTHVLTVASYIHLNPIRAKIVSRLDAKAWTSHRAYVGREPAPAWLTRDVLLSEVGGPKAFHEMVQSLRQGRTEWPDSFDPTSGWLRTEPGQSPWSPHGARQDYRPSERFQAPERVLAEIRSLTGAGDEGLALSRRGRRGNPARLFAVWALERATQLTQREIGHELNLSASRVANILASLHQPQDPTVREWQQRWLSREGQEELARLRRRG